MDWTKAALVTGCSLLAGLGGVYLGYRWGGSPKRTAPQAQGSDGKPFKTHDRDYRDSPLGQYMLNHNLEEPTLTQLRTMSVAHKRGFMTTGAESGKLLTLLCRALGARKVLDVGVFTGCSSYAMALALPQDGKVIACDVSEEYTSLGRPYWEQGGMADKIDLRIQPAADTLQELIDGGEEGTFDLVFVDADKQSYSTYFELGVKLLRTGGLLVVDNALWGGKVADQAVTDDEATTNIRNLNQLMRDDPRVDFVLLNVGDGTGIAQKR